MVQGVENREYINNIISHLIDEGCLWDAFVHVALHFRMRQRPLKSNPKTLK